MNDFVINGIPVKIDLGHYPNGRLSVSLYDMDGEPVCILSRNVPEAEMADGEFCVKNYSENAELAQQAFASGKFIDTGRRVQTGHVEIPVWRLKEPTST